MTKSYTNDTMKMNGYADIIQQSLSTRVQNYIQKSEINKNHNPYKFFKFKNKTRLGILKYKRYVSYGRLAISNPFLKAVNLALQRINRVIALLKMPDFKPILDKARRYLTMMPAQIKSLFENTLRQMSDLVGSHTLDLTLEIERVNTKGSNSLLKIRESYFDNPVDDIRKKAIRVRQKKNQGSKDLIHPRTPVPVEQITKKSYTDEGFINEAVNLVLSGSVSDVFETIGIYNETVYTQIDTLLSDEDYINAILPQFVFADPRVLAGLDSLDTGFSYANVEPLLKDAMTGSGECAKELSFNTVWKESFIIDKAENSSATTPNTHFNALLIAIKQNIDAVANSEIGELLELLYGGVADLTTEIEPIVDNLTPGTTENMNNESKGMV